MFREGKKGKLEWANVTQNNFSTKVGGGRGSSKACLAQLPKGSAFKTLESGQM